MELRTDNDAAGWIKIDLLSHGIEIDKSVSTFLRPSSKIALRKNFYNTPVWIEGLSPIPQELRVLGLVVGLNSYGSSPWRLSWPGKGDALLLENSKLGLRYRPELLPDLRLFSTATEAARIANLYGGTALAFFSPRSCYFFVDGTACAFCSLAGTAEESSAFKDILSDQEIRTTVQSALETDPERIEQIMIVGGNMRDLDRGFKHHVLLARAAADEVARARCSDRISVHIATMPPRNLDLIHFLADFENVHVMFNLEVWDPKTFNAICPGKDKDYGRDGILRALECLRDTIGAYRAHSLLVTGIEPANATAAGACALAEMGISPIINVYHSDRHSRLGLGQRPTFGLLVQVAQALQDLYDKFPIKPYWRNCGRNAIDAEAERGLFRSPIPDPLGCYQFSDARE